MGYTVVLVGNNNKLVSLFKPLPELNVTTKTGLLERCCV